MVGNSVISTDRGEHNILLPASFLFIVGMVDESWCTIDDVEDAIGPEIAGGQHGPPLQDRRPDLIFASLGRRVKAG